MRLIRHDIVFLFLCIVLSGVFFACNPQPEAPALLQRAQTVIDNHPDSAMRLIDSIFYPKESLGRKQYMQYLVTRVQARYKNLRPVAEDTVIFKARDYFTTHDKDLKESSLAWFYSGCVYREQKNYTEAIREYKGARRYALKTNDPDLKGLVEYNIGDLLAAQDFQNKALTQYKIAEGWYAQSPEKPEEKQSTCYSAIGRMFLLLDNQDSAFFYFHKGLQLAENAKNNKLMCLLAQNLSVAYREIKQYAEAEKYLRQSFALKCDSTEIPRYYMNFAQLYAATNQPDSSSLYITKLKRVLDTSEDIYLKASAYNLLADWEKKHQRYDVAFEYQTKRIHTFYKIMEQRKNQSVYEIQQKYDYEEQQSFHKSQLLKQQRWLVILLVGLLLTALLLLFLYRRALIEKKRKLKAYENLQIMQKTTKHLLEKQNRERSNSTLLKETQQWKLDIWKKMEKIKHNLSSQQTQKYKHLLEQLDALLYGRHTKEKVIPVLEAIETIYPGLSQLIRHTYPNLSDNDFNVCLLSYIEIENDIIALILNQSIHTVYKSRSRLNKMIYPNFCLHLREMYQLHVENRG